jgi:hypothetical protein
MLIALIVLAALNLALSFVVFCGQRALWARLPAPHETSYTVGDVTTTMRVERTNLTPAELAEVAAYREKWKVGAEESDAAVLALSRINAT